MSNYEQILDWTANELRRAILMEIAYAIEAQTIENIRNMLNRSSGMLINSVDINAEELDEGNVYIVIGGEKEEGKFDYAVGLEFGTGIYGFKKRYIEAKHMTKSGRKGFMKFKEYIGAKKHKKSIPNNIAFVKEGYVYTQKSRGIEPRYYLTRAVESVLQRQNQITNDVFAYYGVAGIST